MILLTQKTPGMFCAILFADVEGIPGCQQIVSVEDYPMADLDDFIYHTPDDEVIKFDLEHEWPVSCGPQIKTQRILELEESLRRDAITLQHYAQNYSALRTGMALDRLKLQELKAK